MNNLFICYLINEYEQLNTDVPTHSSAVFLILTKSSFEKRVFGVNRTPYWDETLSDGGMPPSPIHKVKLVRLTREDHVRGV